MDSFKTKYNVIVTGLNMHHLIYFLESNNFEIDNIERKDLKTIKFNISKEHYKILKKGKFKTCIQVLNLPLFLIYLFTNNTNP